MKKKLLKEYFKYIVPIYGSLVEVFLCKYEDLPEFMKGGEKTNVHAFAGFTAMAEMIDVPHKFCVWIDKFGWSSRNMATLVHELSHVTDKIALDKGILLDTESRAYILGHLVENFFYMIGKEYN
jgi:hypothetical protein